LYFTAMELLQAATYLVIDQCGLPSNQWLTRASYAHIAVQPFFINALALSFIPEAKSRRLRLPVFAICAAGALAMLAKLHVPDASWACDSSVVPLCGLDTCSFHGDWHIAWRLYLNAADSSFLSYFIPAFFLPLFYGAWRWTLYHLLVGPLTAFFLTSNKDEMPAIWCLTSIAFLLALHVKPMEHWMERSRRAVHDPRGPVLDAADLGIGFGGAGLLIISYVVIRWSAGSPIFNAPALVMLFGALFCAYLICAGYRRIATERRPAPARRAFVDHEFPGAAKPIPPGQLES